jgi:tRNA threonylcarbamoyladenosine biosynthesis protein TsaB
MLLALDTATSTASLALHDLATDRLLAELTWQARRRHTQDVLAQAQHLLALMDLSARDLTALAVTTGPGSFTGVRIGISVVKGMALGLPNAPRVIGAPTLMVTAAPWLDLAAQAAATVCAFIQAGRGRYNWAHFSPGSQLQRPSVDDHHAGALAEFVHTLAEQPVDRVWLAGEIDDELRDAVAPLSHIHVIDAASAQRRAGQLARVAAQFLRSGVEDNLESLQPLYLRAP